MEENNSMSEKGRVCVTGGTGFVASWLIMRLLQHGYYVNTTIRTNPGNEENISFITKLAGASERLKIFEADLNKPESFAPSIEGCIGVFHLAHPMELDEEAEETKTKRVLDALLGILQASLDSKTVKRFVYTSSAAAVACNGKKFDKMDEEIWTDVELMRSLGIPGVSYAIAKTLAERTALEFGEKHGLDVVTVVPPYIIGPFNGPRCPGPVRVSMALIFGSQELYKRLADTSFVHVDDVARAHIFLFEHPNSKGRYICSAKDVTIHELSEFLSDRYPEYQIPEASSLKDVKPSVKLSGLSSKKLMEIGFKYQYGLKEMFDGAIQSCKERGLL